MGADDDSCSTAMGGMQIDHKPSVGSTIVLHLGLVIYLVKPQGWGFADSDGQRISSGRFGDRLSPKRILQ
jgi:hypothetical protein